MPRCSRGIGGAKANWADTLAARRDKARPRPDVGDIATMGAQRTVKVLANTYHWSCQSSDCRFSRKAGSVGAVTLRARAYAKSEWASAT